MTPTGAASVARSYTQTNLLLPGPSMYTLEERLLRWYSVYLLLGQEGLQYYDGAVPFDGVLTTSLSNKPEMLLRKYRAPVLDCGVSVARLHF